MEGFRGPIEAVSFDVDGTLYSIKHLKWRIVTRMARDLKFFLALERERHKLRGGEVEPELLDRIVEAVAERLSRSRQAVAADMERIIHTDWPHVLEGISKPAGMIAMLDRLVHDKVAIGVTSDYPSEEKIAALDLGSYPWRSFVDATASGALKPHPKPYFEFAERMGVEPARILHIGDRHDLDVSGAAAAGMKSMLVGELKSDQSAVPDIHFPNQKALTKAMKRGWWPIES